MCDANQDCQTCIDFAECSTDFMQYCHSVEDVSEEYIFPFEEE
jgi:hypothetical protein